MGRHTNTIFLLNSLARVGLTLQLKRPSDGVLDPSLRPRRITDDGFLDGKSVYISPDSKEPFINVNDELVPSPFDTNTSFVEGKYLSWKRGTAWTLSKNGQQIAVAILSVHVFLVFIHLFVTLASERSTDSWDSIAELLLLAYRTSPQPAAFDNCGGGIVCSATYAQKVRIGSKILKDGSMQAELIICDEEDGAGSIRTEIPYK